MIVAGARFRIAKPPSRMSDTVIGAEPRQAGAAEATASSGTARGTVGGGRHRRARRGRPSPRPRSTGRRAGPTAAEPPHWVGGGLRGEHATATGFADVYDDWYGDVTDARPARSAWPRWSRLAGRRAGPRAGRRLRAGSPSRWPRAASRCTASTPRRRCSSGCGPSPAATRSRSPRATWPTSTSADAGRRSPSCSWPSTRSSTSAPAAAAGAACDGCADRARPRRAVRDRGLRPRRRRHGRPGASVDVPAQSPPTRSC